MADPMDTPEPDAWPGGRGDEPDARGQTPACSAQLPPAHLLTPTVPDTEFQSSCYNMNHKRRGTAIIFNNKKFANRLGLEDRAAKNKGRESGTDDDCKDLYALFTKMGFSVDLQCELTTEKMKTLLQKEAGKDHSDADCFVCAILSYGEEGYVYGEDGHIQIDELVDLFKGDKCKSLAGKPKIFIVQACPAVERKVMRKGLKAAGLGEELEDSGVKPYRIPTEADFLMAYSVVPGILSWDKKMRGSWFIQALNKVLGENWERMDLLSMMIRVCKIVARDFEKHASDTFQQKIPCITSMLTKDVYFKN